MRLSIARASAGDHTARGTEHRDDTGPELSGAIWRRMALALSAVLILGCVGILFGSSKPAGADTPIFASGQVFASVGNSAVNVYSQGVGNPLVTRLNDGLQEPFTAGSAFDSSGNFYVADDYSGDVSEYAPDGTLDGVFASGLSNPLSLVFDNQGNLYVGQQTTPYIAEFSKTGQFVQNIGPLATELTGDDWIALGPDECTIYYTTEGSDILRYDMCHNQQLPNLNVQSFPTYDASTNLPVEAFELQILPDGDVLVADSNADILLDPNGNVLQTYTCASLPDCQGALFAVSLDPDGNSFWTGDSNSGYVWKIDTASGDVLQTIDTRRVPLRPLGGRPDRGGGSAARDDHGAVGARRPAGDRQLLLADAGLGRADQPEHGHAHRERAGDLHPERLRDVHRGHRRHRDGHL